MFKIEQHLEPLEQAPATSILQVLVTLGALSAINVTFCGAKVATFLVGSLESQLGIEIESLENTEHCQVGQMSVGLDSVALSRIEQPQKDVSFSRRIAGGTVLRPRSNECSSLSDERWGR